MFAPTSLPTSRGNGIAPPDGLGAGRIDRPVDMPTVSRVARSPRLPWLFGPASWHYAEPPAAVNGQGHAAAPVHSSPPKMSFPPAERIPPISSGAPSSRPGTTNGLPAGGFMPTTAISRDGKEGPQRPGASLQPGLGHQAQPPVIIDLTNEPDELPAISPLHPVYPIGGTVRESPRGVKPGPISATPIARPKMAPPTFPPQPNETSHVHVAGDTNRNRSSPSQRDPARADLHSAPVQGTHHSKPSSDLRARSSAGAQEGMSETIQVSTESRAEVRRKKRVSQFDSAAFDSLIYAQQGVLPPPPGVVLSANGHSDNPEREPRFLRVNPEIHFRQERSKEWHDWKTEDIEKRPNRKAWFGKVIQRQRWLNEQRRRHHGQRGIAESSGRARWRVDPEPWGHRRPLDFSLVPADELPDDVKENPAWARACARFRWNRSAREELRDARLRGDG